MIGGAARPGARPARPGGRGVHVRRGRAGVPARAGSRGRARRRGVTGAGIVDTIVAPGPAGRPGGGGGARPRRHDAATSASSPRRAARRAARRPATCAPLLGDGDGKQFACFCMDVTSKELSAAVKEGFDSIELLKRYTTLSMGPVPGEGVPDQLEPPVRHGHRTERRPRPGSPRRGRRGRRCRWACWRRSARTPGARPRCTTGTSRPGRRSCGPASGAGRTTTSTPAAEVRAVHRGRRRDRRQHPGEAPRQGSGRRRVLERLYPNTFGDLPWAHPVRPDAERPGRHPGRRDRVPVWPTTSSSSRSPPVAPTRWTGGSAGGWPTGACDVHVAERVAARTPR